MLAAAAREPKHAARLPAIPQERRRSAESQQDVTAQRGHHYGSVTVSAKVGFRLIVRLVQ